MVCVDRLMGLVLNYCRLFGLMIVNISVFIMLVVRKDD